MTAKGFHWAEMFPWRSSWAEQKTMLCSCPLGGGAYLVSQMSLKGQTVATETRVALGSSRAAVSRTEPEDGTKRPGVKPPSCHDSESQQNICWNKSISRPVRRIICSVHSFKRTAEVKICFLPKGSPGFNKDLRLSTKGPVSPVSPV